jgi:hypothetical protein
LRDPVPSGDAIQACSLGFLPDPSGGPCRLRGADAVYVAFAATRQLPLINLDAEILERAPASMERPMRAEWLQRSTARVGPNG